MSEFDPNTIRGMAYDAIRRAQRQSPAPEQISPSECHSTLPSSRGDKASPTSEGETPSAPDSERGFNYPLCSKCGAKLNDEADCVNSECSISHIGKADSSAESETPRHSCPFCGTMQVVGDGWDCGSFEVWQEPSDPRTPRVKQSALCAQIERNTELERELAKARQERDELHQTYERVRLSVLPNQAYLQLVETEKQLATVREALAWIAETYGNSNQAGARAIAALAAIEGGENATTEARES